MSLLNKMTIKSGDLKKVLISKYWLLIAFVWSAPAFADLPAPPSSMQPTGDESWLDVIAKLAFKGLGYAFLVGGVAAALYCVFGILHGLNEMKDKNGKIGEFFKHAGTHVFGFVLAIAIAFVGNSWIPSGK